MFPLLFWTILVFSHGQWTPIFYTSEYIGQSLTKKICCLLKRTYTIENIWEVLRVRTKYSLNPWTRLDDCFCGIYWAPMCIQLTPSLLLAPSMKTLVIALPPPDQNMHQEKKKLPMVNFLDLFLTFGSDTSSAQNKNLRPLLNRNIPLISGKYGLRNHWKVFFSWVKVRKRSLTFEVPCSRF